MHFIKKCPLNVYRNVERSNGFEQFLKYKADEEKQVELRRQRERFEIQPANTRMTSAIMLRWKKEDHAQHQKQSEMLRHFQRNPHRY